MAEENTTPDATPEKTPDKEPTGTPPATEDAPLGDAGQKALDAFKSRAREAEARVKELQPLADKARELEEAQQTELEKAQAKLTKAEKATATAASKLLRYEVAQEKEVPAKLVALLTATSRDDLLTQADLILENTKAGEVPPDFDGGAREAAPENETPEDAHNAQVLKMLGIN